PVPGQPDLPLRPDMVITRGERRALIVDAKWKRLGRAPLPADTYQVLTYATLLGAGRAVLVYPGRRDRTGTYTFPGAPLTLQIHTLCVVGLRQRCQRSLQRLGRVLLAFRAT